VTPSQFLGTAEESGLIVPIGWWALEAGCHQIRDWQLRIAGAQGLWLGINMSARVLMRYETVERMEHVLERTGIRPGSLQIEVTEHDLLDHGEAAERRIHELRSLGIRIGIDDFGTGQSSLTCVERFQFDVLKIDSSRTGALDNGNGGPRFIRSIVSLAADLGIDVIAEGVETESQLLALRELECPLGQGFWIARPVVASGAEALFCDAPSRWCHG
jgi:EAL domain-containing protein (putative c-di-GMP-specific phosphodiesterase class I)